MQQLGLTDPEPKTDSRLKSLFWPTIRTRVDLDTVTTQGFWICLVVGVVTMAVSLLTRNSLVIGLGALASAFYILAGFGSRMQSRIAAAGAFLAYLLDTVVLQKETGQGLGVVRIIFLALLLANVRGIWISASWQPSESDPPPAKLNENWRDKLVDQWPAAIWPWGRFVFYAAGVVEIGLLALSLVPRTRS
jgi:hypothetical protein